MTNTEITLFFNALSQTFPLLAGYPPLADTGWGPRNRSVDEHRAPLRPPNKPPYRFIITMVISELDILFLLYENRNFLNIPPQ